MRADLRRQRSNGRWRWRGSIWVEACNRWKPTPTLTWNVLPEHHHQRNYGVLTLLTVLCSGHTGGVHSAAREPRPAVESKFSVQDQDATSASDKIESTVGTPYSG